MSLASFLKTALADVEHVLGIMGDDVVQAVAPIVAEEVANAGSAIATAVATGKGSSVLAVAGSILASAGAKIETNALAGGIEGGLAIISQTLTQLAAHPAVAAASNPTVVQAAAQSG